MCKTPNSDSAETMNAKKQKIDTPADMIVEVKEITSNTAENNIATPKVLSKNDDMVTTNTVPKDEATSKDEAAPKETPQNDPKEAANVEYKVDTFSTVYKKLTGKEVKFEFPPQQS